MQIKEQGDAGKERRGRSEAVALARAADKVIVARGKKIVEFDMKNPPEEDTLLAEILGPTDNLRAPTLRKGKTLLVGFSDQAYRQFFSG